MILFFPRRGGMETVSAKENSEAIEKTRKINHTDD